MKLDTHFIWRATGNRLQARARSRGINLIELLIAMVLGLLVVGGAISIFVTNQQTYAATESLGRIQENTRTAFELMVREIRESGGDPCGNRDWAPVNVLTNADVDWWSTWGIERGLRGFDEGEVLATPDLPAAGVGSRVPGTDVIEVLSAAGSGVTLSAVPTATISTNQNHPFVVGDILLICDYNGAAVFQMTGPAGAAGSNNTILHAVGAGTPGNCTGGLALVPSESGGGQAAICANTVVQRFGQDINGNANGSATVARLAATRWYVGNTGRVNQLTNQPLFALFRSTLRQGAIVNEEIAEGVVDMQVTYRLPLSVIYRTATDIVDVRWKEVTAVNITLTLAGQDQGEVRLGTDGAPLRRTVNYVANLRNRNN